MFRLFALSLNLSEDHFDAMMSHPGGIARLLYYPPSKDPQPLDPIHKDKEIGLGAHSDYECFTLLLASSAAGLEILSPDNVWVPAPAVDGSFIVNVADFLMRWTNGVYKSTVHRVVNRTRDERYSVPFFFSVNYDQLVEVCFRHRLSTNLKLTGNADFTELRFTREPIKVHAYKGWRIRSRALESNDERWIGPINPEHLFAHAQHDNIPYLRTDSFFCASDDPTRAPLSASEAAVPPSELSSLKLHGVIKTK